MRAPETQEPLTGRGLSGVPNGARTRNHWFHRPVLCQLSYRHHRSGISDRKPGSVSGDHLSRFIRTGRKRLLSTLSLGEQPASGSVGDCCGEDCPFHSSPPGRRLGLCCSRDSVAAITPIWTVDMPSTACRPDFHRAPTLCAARTFLWPGQRSPVRNQPLVKVTASECWPWSMVPKGRFELPRPYGHYALNVARLPVPPLRRDIHLSRENYITVHLARQWVPDSKIDGIASSMSIVSRLLGQRSTRRKNLKIQLLSRPGCHLCDEALVSLQREFGAANIEVLNITDDKDLEDEYVFRIPVVLFEGSVLTEGVIGPREARLARQRAARLRRDGADRS